MFHVSREGVVGKCRAQVPARCPYSASSGHYSTRQEAQFHADRPEPLTPAEQQLSKKIAFLLRHHPEQAGLTPDQYGQVPTLALALALDTTPETLTRVVYLDGKQRYLFTDNERHISAVQGHSYPVKVRAISTTPPPFLYHGTKQQFLDSILTTGLRPGSRQHVHLSAAVDTADDVAGRRAGESIILTVDTAAAGKAGVKFIQAPNGVWLTTHVPPAAIQQP